MQLKSFIEKHSPQVLFNVKPRLDQFGAPGKEAQMELTMHFAPKTGIGELKREVDQLYSDYFVSRGFEKPNFSENDGAGAVVRFFAPKLAHKKIDGWHRTLSEIMHRQFNKGIFAEFDPHKKPVHFAKAPEAIDDEAFSQIMAEHAPSITLETSPVSNPQAPGEPVMHAQIKLKFRKMLSNVFVLRNRFTSKKWPSISTHIGVGRSSLVLRGNLSSEELRELYSFFEHVGERWYTKEATAFFVPKK